MEGFSSTGGRKRSCGSPWKAAADSSPISRELERVVRDAMPKAAGAPSRARPLPSGLAAGVDQGIPRHALELTQARAQRSEREKSLAPSARIAKVGSCNPLLPPPRFHTARLRVPPTRPRLRQLECVPGLVLKSESLPALADLVEVRLDRDARRGDQRRGERRINLAHNRIRI